MTTPTQEDDVKQLRDALALGPLPGAWAVGPDFDNDGTLERIVCALDGAAVVAVAMDFGPNNPHLRAANAAFIAAANPERIARLLARLEQAERDAGRLDWVIANRNLRVQGKGANWMVLDCRDGLTFITQDHSTPREAIDAAIASEVKT